MKITRHRKTKEVTFRLSEIEVEYLANAVREGRYRAMQEAHNIDGLEIDTLSMGAACSKFIAAINPIIYALQKKRII